jgi:hypothetical protein
MRRKDNEGDHETAFYGERDSRELSDQNLRENSGTQDCKYCDICDQTQLV